MILLEGIPQTCFIENFSAVFDAAAQLLLFFFWKLNNAVAVRTARPVILFRASDALNEQQVASNVEAIGVIVARSPALVAFGNHIC